MNQLKMVINLILLSGFSHNVETTEFVEPLLDDSIREKQSTEDIHMEKRRERRGQRQNQEEKSSDLLRVFYLPSSKSRLWPNP